MCEGPVDRLVHDAMFEDLKVNPHHRDPVIAAAALMTTRCVFRDAESGLTNEDVLPRYSMFTASAWSRCLTLSSLRASLASVQWAVLPPGGNRQAHLA